MDVVLDEFGDGFRVGRANRWHTAVAEGFLPAAKPEEDIKAQVTLILHKAGLTIVRHQRDADPSVAAPPVVDVAAHVAASIETPPETMEHHLSSVPGFVVDEDGVTLVGSCWSELPFEHAGEGRVAPVGSRPFRLVAVTTWRIGQ